jgi:hypothetical protein
MQTVLPRCAVFAAAAAVLITACATPVRAASEPVRWALLDDNDGMISGQDRHYTQGLRVTRLSPPPAPGSLSERIFDAVGTVLPMYRRGGLRRLNWIVFGQSVFTPEDLNLSTPDPSDRPYAGWVYTGASLLQENDGRDLNSIEVLVGMIGPDAFGRGSQDGFHRVFGFGNANGWTHQLGNRGAFQFSMERHERFGVDLGRGWGIDAVPEVGVSAGSVFQYVEAGVALRTGTALHADYGPDHIRPAFSGTGYFNERGVPPHQVSFYAMVGAQTRRMFFDRFIDAAHEVAPAGLQRLNTVNDVFAGFSLFFGHTAHADFTATRRSREFAGQQRPDLFGSAALTVEF